MPPLDMAGFSVLLLLGAALCAPFLSRCERLLIPAAFLTATSASLSAICAGFAALHHGSNSAATLAMGLPVLPFNLRLDPLAGFFLIRSQPSPPSSPSTRSATSAAISAIGRSPGW